MSDLACWPMSIIVHEDAGYDNGAVVRIHGSEHFLGFWELRELREMLETVIEDNCETLGEGYKELQADREAQAKQSKGGLLAKLGLQRVPAIKRRSI